MAVKIELLHAEYHRVLERIQELECIWDSQACPNPDIWTERMQLEDRLIELEAIL